MAEFIKSQLKTGMVVETRSGTKYLVLKGRLDTTCDGSQELIFINNGGFLIGSNYNSNMESTNYYFTIMKVYAPPPSSLVRMFDKCCKSNLVWDRGREVDWTTIPVDTKVLVKRNPDDRWQEGHFARFENGKIHTFMHGRTSWTASPNDTFSWELAKLAKEDEQ